MKNLELELTMLEVAILEVLTEIVQKDKGPLRQVFHCYYLLHWFLYHLNKGMRAVSRVIILLSANRKQLFCGFDSVKNLNMLWTN